MLVAVGSKSPVKIEATRRAFAATWPSTRVEVVGYSVPSGVSEQPTTDDESVIGARNRANGALSAGKADYGVGLEGGLHQVDGRWFDSGWAVVLDAKGREGSGSTLRMAVPPPVLALLQEGQDLGAACDAVFARQDSKKGTGFFGAMTNDALDRVMPYRDAVIAALSVFLNIEMWYSDSGLR